MAIWKGAPGGQYTKGRSQAVSKVTIHHAAGTSLQGVYNVFANASYGTSATYAVEGGTVWQFLLESDTPWSDGNWDSNSKSISIEMVNSSTGGQWPVSAETLEGTCQLIADIHKRYGWAKATKGGTITWHSMYYSTACPGPTVLANMDNIVNRVNEILKAGKEVKQEPGTAKNNNGLYYQMHVQDLGWLDPVHDGQAAGTVGGSKRGEALRIDLRKFTQELEFELCLNLANVGQTKKFLVNKDTHSQIIGTIGEKRAFENITIRQTKNKTGKKFYIQVHSASIGWGNPVLIEDFAKSVGTVDAGLAVEAIRIWGQ